MYAAIVAALLISQCLGKELTEQPFAHDSAVVEAVVNLIRENCILPQDNLLLRRLAYVETQDGTLPQTFRADYYGGIWQVDEEMLMKTKESSPILDPLHAKIKQVFNRDWSLVAWNELLKPLYSGLAAALFIAQTTGGVVPQNIEEQGTYWETSYRNGTSAHNYTTMANMMDKGCVGNEAIDLMFLVDSSSSLSTDDFVRAKGFVSNVVSKFSIGPSNTRIAFIRYSSEVQKLISFSSTQNLQFIRNEIYKIPYVSGKTATADALNVARNSFIADSPRDVIKVVVLVTDGESDDKIDTEHAVKNLKDEGVVVFAIGVGSLVDNDELRNLATSPSCTHSFTVENFRAINSFVEEIEHSVCRAPLYANETVTCLIGKCPPYAFPITDKGITITANITCGVTSVYTSITQQYPSEASYSHHEIITKGKTVELFQEFGAGAFEYAYVNVDNKIGGGTSESCRVTLTPFEGRLRHIVNVYCEEDGVRRPCTLNERCPGSNNNSGYNPCITENMKNGKTKFPFPGDNTKFYMCDKSGQAYVVNCPVDQVFSPSCQSCYGSKWGIVTDCNNYNSNFNYMCTVENIQANKLYFAHPQNISLYIQCDLWGQAFVKSCLGLGPDFIWQELKLSCEHRDTGINPCPHMNIDGQRFYAYPPNEAKFIQCNDQLDPLIYDCPAGLIWDDCIKTCQYRASVTKNCHIDPKGPLAYLIPIYRPDNSQ